MILDKDEYIISVKQDFHRVATKKWYPSKMVKWTGYNWVTQAISIGESAKIIALDLGRYQWFHLRNKMCSVSQRRWAPDPSLECHDKVWPPRTVLSCTVLAQRSRASTWSKWSKCSQSQYSKCSNEARAKSQKKIGPKGSWHAKTKPFANHPHIPTHLHVYTCTCVLTIIDIWVIWVYTYSYTWRESPRSAIFKWWSHCSD